jgi:hypothetical protein
MVFGADERHFARARQIERREESAEAAADYQYLRLCICHSAASYFRGVRA